MVCLFLVIISVAKGGADNMDFVNYFETLVRANFRFGRM